MYTVWSSCVTTSGNVASKAMPASTPATNRITYAMARIHDAKESGTIGDLQENSKRKYRTAQNRTARRVVCTLCEAIPRSYTAKLYGYSTVQDTESVQSCVYTLSVLCPLHSGKFGANCGARRALFGQRCQSCNVANYWNGNASGSIHGIAKQIPQSRNFQRLALFGLAL